MLDKIQATLSASWFHGDISSSDADKLLYNDGRAGAFLIRFSIRDAGAFTLARLISTKDVQEVVKLRIKNNLHVGLALAGSYFSSLPELVSKIANQYNLKHAATGSQFVPLVIKYRNKYITKQKKRASPPTVGPTESLYVSPEALINLPSPPYNSSSSSSSSNVSTATTTPTHSPLALTPF
jgi:hypothetical protein